MKIIETIDAFGHENILSTHKTTLEITKEKHLTKRGDCIIAVKATKGALDLPIEFKEAARKENAKMTITIEADAVKEVINAQGSPHLLFSHPTDLVIRKSDYVCGRTLAVRADKAACDLSRQLVEKLRNPSQKIRIMLSVDY
jgi:hypothetical protein